MGEIEYSGMVLMLILGLRHGFDPDHIAVIDGLAMRAQNNTKKIAPWVGTFFALGHGLVVTAIAVGIHFIHQLFTLPKSFFAVLEWLPVALLILVGILNLRSLLAHKDQFKPVSWRSRFVPKSLREKVHPLSVLLTGVIFALVFDTATQAAAWGYAASTNGGWLTALVMGLVFTLGMVFTDTLDGLLLNKIWKNYSNKNVLLKSRRILGWGIVSLSFIVALYKIISTFLPAITLSDAMITFVGFSFFIAIIIFYIYTWFVSKTAQKLNYGH